MFETSLRSIASQLGVALAEPQVLLLCNHYRLLASWNQHINLTAICGPQQAARRHYGESLFLHQLLPATDSLVDVGSGAGFPGVPVAVMRPESSVTLLESKNRKAAFLRQATRGMGNIEIQSCRLSDWQGTAEWALLRAVSVDKILPDLTGKVRNIAILGTDQTINGEAYRWEAYPLPWGDRQLLWLGFT